MPTTNQPLIWIVDDDTDDQYLFEVALKRLLPTVAIELLDDGEDLLPALTETSGLPRLIILDLNMPRLNGFEALAQLRAEPDFCHIPVIVLTTSSYPEDQEKAAALGANGFLTKPPSMDLLLVLFNQLIDEWQLNEVEQE